MTLYGYYRCSTTEQHEERQIRALKDANCQVIRGDKVTGTSDFSSRPELTALLNEMESGSTMLSELSRLSQVLLALSMK